MSAVAAAPERGGGGGGGGFLSDAATRKRVIVVFVLCAAAVLAYVIYRRWSASGNFAPVDGSCPSNAVMNPVTQECECAPGYYAGVDNAGNGVCLPCPPGSYSGQGATECTLCPAGTTTANAASTSSSACFNANVNNAQLCTPGFYFDENQQSCAVCPQNSFSDSSASNQCTACPLGTYTTTDGATSVSQCLTFGGSGRGCPPGYFYDKQTNQCLLCPEGTWSNGGYIAACQSCPAGTTSPAGANTVALCQGVANSQTCAQAIEQMLGTPCNERNQFTMPGACSTPAEKIAWRRAQCFGAAASGCQTACGAAPECLDLCNEGASEGGMGTCQSSSCLIAMLQNIPCEQRCALINSPNYQRALTNAGLYVAGQDSQITGLIANPFGCQC